MRTFLLVVAVLLGVETVLAIAEAGATIFFGCLLPSACACQLHVHSTRQNAAIRNIMESASLLCPSSNFCDACSEQLCSQSRCLNVPLVYIFNVIFINCSFVSKRRTGTGCMASFRAALFAAPASTDLVYKPQHASLAGVQYDAFSVLYSYLRLSFCSRGTEV